MQSLIEKTVQKIKKFFPHNKGKRVDFLIAGTQKGGTSALNAYLKEHPELCMADKKEVHFFDNESVFADDTPDYISYHASFSLRASHKLMGEATPIYMYWYSAARRIWEYNPEMKVIIILRNPIERAYSHWNMERMKNQEDLSFWDAIQNEQERCQESLPLQHRIYSYMDRGFYSEQLRRLWFYFSKERVLVLRQEYLQDKPQETLDKVCDFLEVARMKNIISKDVHSRPYESKMQENEHDYLQSVFEYEIRTLERVLNWDCSDWLEKQ